MTGEIDKSLSDMPNPGSDEAIAIGCTCPVSITVMGAATWASKACSGIRQAVRCTRTRRPTLTTESLIAAMRELAHELDSQARDSAINGMPEAASAYRESRDKLRLLAKRAERELQA